MGNCIKKKSSENVLSKGITKSNKNVLCKEETDKGIFILGLFLPSKSSLNLIFSLVYKQTKCLCNQKD